MSRGHGLLDPAAALRLALALVVMALLLMGLALLLVLVPAPVAMAAQAGAAQAGEEPGAAEVVQGQASQGQAPQGPDGPRYVERLDLPVETDSLLSPRSVTADLHTGEVFVTDLHRDRVVIFGPDGAFRFQIRGGEVFRAPQDLAVDPQGYLYLAANRGTQDVLLKLDFDGQPVGEIELSGLEEASGLAWGPPEDGTARAEAVAATPDAAEPADPEPEPPADPDPAPRHLVPLRVVSLALSPAGDRLYLLDEGNKRLWLATPDGRVARSVDLTEGLSANKARDLELGHVDVYGDQVLVAMASLGEVHLFDLGGERRGHVGFHGTGPCQQAFPVAAALDAGGDYLVIDQQRMLILRWSPVGNRCVGEYWGLGSKPGYFYFPFDLALGPPPAQPAAAQALSPDSPGRLYVSQGYEGRVQAYTVAEPAALPEEKDEEERGE